MQDYKPLSPQELNRGYFLLKNRPLIKKIILGLALLVIIVIYSMVVVNLVSLVRSQSYLEASKALTDNTNWAAYHQARSPLPLTVSSAQVISLGNFRYDLVAFINNPNDDWAAKAIDYKFIVNNQELPLDTSFLNPGESRLLVKTGYTYKQAISSVSVEIEGINWRRFDNDSPVVNWDVSNIKYQPVTRQTEGNESFVLSPRATWSAQNLSLFDFWDVGWQVALLSGDKVVAVKETKVSDFNSLQTKEIEVVWLNDLPRVTKTLVYPMLNWLDDSSFKPAGLD